MGLEDHLPSFKSLYHLLFYVWSWGEIPTSVNFSLLLGKMEFLQVWL